jgi:RNA polymerase I-specific transcription initiation factor RRN3
VEISLDVLDDEDEEDEDEDEHQLQFQFEEKAKSTSSQEEARGIAEMAEKLDGLMMVLFEYITAECKRDESSCDRTFRLFLRIFDSFVISTYRCKFVQFLVYYLAQFKTDLPDLFLGYLLNKLLDQTQPALTRKVCASYVASFVSRAPFIRLETIRNTLAVLVGWLHKYLDVHEHKPPNPALHALFYHVCQSVYYIVCFRYNELLRDEEGLEFFRQLGFERVNEAKLSPLRVGANVCWSGVCLLVVSHSIGGWVWCVFVVWVSVCGCGCVCVSFFFFFLFMCMCSSRLEPRSARGLLSLLS